MLYRQRVLKKVQKDIVSYFLNYCDDVKTVFYHYFIDSGSHREKGILEELEIVIKDCAQKKSALYNPYSTSLHQAKINVETEMARLEDEACQHIIDKLNSLTYIDLYLGLYLKFHLRIKNVFGGSTMGEAAINALIHKAGYMQVSGLVIDVTESTITLEYFSDSLCELYIDYGENGQEFADNLCRGQSVSCDIKVNRNKNVFNSNRGTTSLFHKCGCGCGNYKTASRIYFIAGELMN